MSRPRLHNKKLVAEIRAVIIKHCGNEELADNVVEYISVPSVGADGKPATASGVSSPTPSPPVSGEGAGQGQSLEEKEAAGRNTYVLQKERPHILPSAGYWFKGSRKAQDAGQHAEAVMCMENAYNHVENALAAARDFIEAYFVRGVLRFPDGRTYRQHAKELLSRTGGSSNASGIPNSSSTSPS